MRRYACGGADRLSKRTFLGMLGADRYKQPNPTPTFSDSERARVLLTLDYCDGNKTRAASLLGITVETLNRKLKNHPSPEQPSDEIASPNATRRFFESISSDWEVTSFDAGKREACTRVNLPHGKNHFSTILPKPA